MRILGVDPGLGRLGWGVIEVKGSSTKAVAYDCIETSKSLSEEKRLATIYQKLSDAIALYKPEVAVVEQLFFSRNVTTAFMVGQARGVVLLTAAQAQLAVVSYSPSQIKVAVTGYGRAEKKQIAQMVKVILGLSKAPRLDDTTDALAIALTHAFTRR